jgi:hypothetical protein
MMRLKERDGRGMWNAYELLEYSALMWKSEVNKQSGTPKHKLVIILKLFFRN